ncbi:MAG: DUF2585 family protein [Rhizobiales bacterium]|nr:DUF2585 family protein [Hyphomicrobiales bacterium]
MTDTVLPSGQGLTLRTCGFGLASAIAVWVSVTAVILIEIVLSYLIRDNLFLSVLMLIYPVDGIRAWQAAPPL